MLPARQLQTAAMASGSGQIRLPWSAFVDPRSSCDSTFRTGSSAVQEYERCARYILPACSRNAGRHIDQTFAILDMKGEHQPALEAGESATQKAVQAVHLRQATTP